MTGGEHRIFAAGGYKAVVDAPEKEGPITDAEGRLLGTPYGCEYTGGQRRVLGGGRRDALYVTRIVRNVSPARTPSFYARELIQTASLGEHRGAPAAAPPGREIRYRNAALRPCLPGREAARRTVRRARSAQSPGQWAGSTMGIHWWAGIIDTRAATYLARYTAVRLILSGQPSALRLHSGPTESA